MSRTASLTASNNLFVSSLTFTYQFPEHGNSSLEIYDVSGRLISSYVVPPDSNTYNWNGRNTSGEKIPPGIYIARLGGYEQTTIKLIKL